jgi:hypothetical protein
LGRILASCPEQNFCPFWKNYIKRILGTVALRELVAIKINGLLKLSNDQNDASKSNESKAQQIPLNSFLYQIL